MYNVITNQNDTLYAMLVASFRLHYAMRQSNDGRQLAHTPVIQNHFKRFVFHSLVWLYYITAEMRVKTAPITDASLRQESNALCPTDMSRQPPRAHDYHWPSNMKASGVYCLNKKKWNSRFSWSCFIYTSVTSSNTDCTPISNHRNVSHLGICFLFLFGLFSVWGRSHWCDGGINCM